MNEKEKKEIEEIEMDIVIMSGGLEGLAVGERNRTVKDLLYEKSSKLLEIHGRLVRLREKKEKLK